MIPDWFLTYLTIVITPLAAASFVLLYRKIEALNLLNAEQRNRWSEKG